MSEPDETRPDDETPPRPEPADPTGHNPPSAPAAQEPPVGTPDPTTNVGLERGYVIGHGLRAMSEWSLRLIIIAVAVGGTIWILSQVWAGIVPIFFALLLASLLWPPVRWAVTRGVPPALASVGVILVSMAVVGGILVAIAPSVVEQSAVLVNRAADGVREVRDWLAGPPLSIENERLDDFAEEAQQWLQDRSSDIASGVFSGVTTVGSIIFTFLLVIVLTFFFLKDGPRFLPWVRRVGGRRAGSHLTELFSRVWSTLAGFLRVQMIVSAVDAVLIGIGLVILGIPLAFALAVMTFFGGLIPIVGAVAVGALAVLVALVSNGFTTALIVLVIILAVQQLEGNLLQPLLQSRTMEMHPAIILLAVAGAGTLFGIMGAFLAVPVAATIIVVLRYMSEQVDLRTGDVRAEDLKVATPEGAAIAAEAERAGTLMLRRHVEDRIQKDADEEVSPEAERRARSMSDLIHSLAERMRHRE